MAIAHIDLFAITKGKRLINVDIVWKTIILFGTSGNFLMVLIVRSDVKLVWVSLGIAIA